MLRMGSCMANLDHAALEAMEAKSEAFEKDRQRLCQAGQRDAALQRARRFGLAMRSDPLQPEPGHPRSDRERITAAGAIAQASLYASAIDETDGNGSGFAYADGFKISF